MQGTIKKRGKTFTYYFTYTDAEGKKKQASKGGFLTSEDADMARKRAILEYKETNFVQRRCQYSLAEYIDYWFENIAQFNLRYESLRLYKTTAKNHIKPELGKLPLDKITVTKLQSFFTKKQSDYSPSLTKQLKTILNMVFELAEEQKLIRSTPMTAVKLSNSKKKRKKKPFTKEELQLLLDELKRTSYYNAVFTAIHTGMRRGEILGLTWENLDMENRIVHIKHQLQIQNKEFVLAPTKTESSERSLKMTSALYQFFIELKAYQKEQRFLLGNDYYQGTDFVCCHSNGFPISPTALTNHFAYTAKRLEIVGSFHDLRHTHATMMLEADANVKILQERLGHADITTLLNTYSHKTKKLEDDSIARFDSFFS